MNVGDDCVLKGFEFGSCEGFCHAVGSLVCAFYPNDFEGPVATQTVVAEEMMRDPDVSSELGGSVIIRQVDGGFVVNVDLDRSSNDLAGNALDYVDDPEK